MRRFLPRLLLLAVTACGPDGSGPVPPTIAAAGGDAQSGVVGTALAQPLMVLVTDGAGAPLSGVGVEWAITAGGGAVAPESSFTNAQGTAATTFTLGTAAGTQAARATMAGSTGSPVAFTATALAGPATQLVKYSGDGQAGTPGQALPVLLAVRVQDQYGNGVAGIIVSWTVTVGGGTLSTGSVASGSTGIAQVSYTLGPDTGSNTVTATASGLAPVTFSATAVAQAVLVATVPIPPNYGTHDTFVRDGLAFVFAWNSGVMIYDVGNGVKGGTPASPQLVSSYVTNGGEVHNGWWFWNPATSEKKYLFIGQEGPGSIGASSSGDIHVVDVSNLNAPTEVAFFHIDNAGPHNFWMDEAAQILYSSYYNGGVVALNVSGTLSGDLSARGIDTIVPGGAGNTYVWGVQLYNGSLYAVDMMSGFWQLGVSSGHLSVAAGGNNVPERYGSDLWVANGYAYTGTWYFRSGHAGNAVKIWQLNGAGAPVLVDSIITANINTVSDLEVSPDGKLLMFSAEGGTGAGFYFYDLTNPASPAFISSVPVATGVHTATFGTINGRLYAFGAKDPGNPALLIYDVTSLIP